MTRVGSMRLSPEQAHNMEQAEAMGHRLEQLSHDKFHCGACDLWAYVTNDVVGLVFQKQCGAMKVRGQTLSQWAEGGALLM